MTDTTLINTYQYWMPTRIIFGEGTLSHLADVTKHSAGRIMVVSNGSMVRLGILDSVREILGSNRMILFDRITPNPNPAIIDEAVEVARSEGCETVVGIGGGSASM